ncbi:hypothetical protein [Lysobacter hankyongensis]|uniref:Transmembrane protein n=1 Tax=Lysobacter hankyongensis TaxID=1176535 RepID=A0ABP9CD19_9GAMM
MSDATVSAVMALSFVTLLAIAIALLFFVAVAATVSATGLARERGRERFAVLAMVVPVIGWFYLIRHGRSTRWLLRYLLIGLGALAGAALLSYSILQRGPVAQ